MFISNTLKKVNNTLYGSPKNVVPWLALTLLHKCYDFIGIAIQNNIAKLYLSKCNCHVRNTSATCMKFSMYPATLEMKFSMH